MSVNIQNAGQVITAYISGEIDHHTARNIREQIDAEVELNQPTLLVLDFSDVTFMDSSGIGVIAGRYKEIKARGGKVMIIRVKPQVDKILEISGLKTILECSN